MGAAFNLKSAIRIAGIIAFILLSILLILFLLQDKLIFQADKLSRDYTFVFNSPFEEHFITTPDHIELNLLWFKPSQESKGLVIYFHGNADNLQRWGQYAGDLTRLGYEVLMMDYRGYGKSGGKPSEQVLYEDAALIWKWAKEKSNAQKRVIYGRSLGSAVATHLAAEVKPDLLILETPFDELRGASVLPYLYACIPLRHRFATKEIIGKVPCKTVIFQGTDDWVVSVKSASRLKPLLKKTDEFILIPDGGHNNLSEFALYHSHLAATLQP